jgi:hypothetical protein
MSREIMTKLDAADIGIASSTYDIVGLPPLRVRLEPGGDGLTNQLSARSVAADTHE